ncbi:FtsX-like permease family protein [Hufsiella ginkgonis]|uniref:FtsX-like permease family protein n=1 Tax=Hufsiella ginkgonis TaxID=2695274 RepID=A0A7K1XVX2_9SPHI|nr:FtsX-like permease family protein [Hufsiella ginkgonis]MXV14958.1 FtsX-like permease family protein [Hufsiella ginkgonis]
MNTSFYIAKRYLFSKKSFNAINFISGISVLGVFVGSAALIIILSVFNGFENVILSMYNTFTPEIRIEPALGKTFDPSAPYFTVLRKDTEIRSFAEVLQEKALVGYRKGKYIGLIKGVDDKFLEGKMLDSTIIAGAFTLHDKKHDFAVVGAAVQGNLGINVNDDFTDLEIYSPRKGDAAKLNSTDPFNVKEIHPAGVFSVQQQFDEIIIVPLRFARELLEEQTNVSAIEITLKNKNNVDKMQQRIIKLIGSDFIVKNRMQQDQNLYKTLNVEKFSIYLILTFVLIIAIFNIIGSLTMLVIDKRQDIAILSSIGADSRLIRNIFFTEGMMISMMGCVSGMVAGLGFCLLQMHYGFVKMNAENMITDSYPVGLKWQDFLLVFATVTIISTITSAVSSRLSVKHLVELKKDL